MNLDLPKLLFTDHYLNQINESINNEISITDVLLLAVLFWIKISLTLHKL